MKLAYLDSFLESRLSHVSRCHYCVDKVSAIDFGASMLILRVPFIVSLNSRSVDQVYSIPCP